MIIRKYNEFTKLITEAEEDEFGLEPEEGGDEAADEGDEGDEGEEGEEEEDMVFNDAPEVYVTNAIKSLKTKIENLFSDDESSEEEVDNPINLIGPDGAEAVDRSKREKENKESMTLEDMGAKLESSEIIKSSKTHKSLVVKFTDDENYYALYIKLSLKEAIDLIADNEELTEESIQNAYVKMKKISLDGFKELGTVNRNVMVADIDEDFIVELKLELDGESTGGNDDEKLEIET